MPLYEYRCNDCSNEFEELVSGSQTSVACPKCNSHHVERKLSTFSASVPSSGSMPCGASSPSGCGSGGFT